MTPQHEAMRTELLQKGKARLDEVKNACATQLPEFRNNYAFDAMRHICPELSGLVSTITTDDARAKLNKVACNEYWLLYIVLTAASQTDELPLTDDDIFQAAEVLRRIYSNQPLLERVLTGKFHELSESEMAAARQDGLIVSDETWPFVDDQDRINPMFC